MDDDSNISWVVPVGGQPENLLVGDDGHLKLCDFGSAKVMEDQKSMVEGADKADGSGTIPYVVTTCATMYLSLKLNGTLARLVAPEEVERLFI